MSKTLKRILAAVVLCVPLLCVAGRPVFHELSLPELAQSSGLIAIVAKAPAEVAIKGAYGCESLEWRLSVVSILKASPGIPAKPGSKIDVRLNATSYEDCVLRKGGGTKGASFPASRYKPSDPDAPRQRRFIVFLQPGDAGFRLAADLAFESIGKRSDVESLVNEQH